MDCLELFGMLLVWVQSLLVQIEIYMFRSMDLFKQHSTYLNAE